MSLVTAKYDIYHFIFPCSRESFVRGDYIIRNYWSQNRRQNILGGKKWQKEMNWNVISDKAMAKWSHNTLMRTRLYRDGTAGAQKSRASEYETMLAKHTLTAVTKLESYQKCIIPSTMQRE